jgi:hypothetical protein
MLALHFATNLKHETITEMRQCRQPFGNVTQEWITILHLQRVRGSEHNVQFGITKLEQLRHLNFLPHKGPLFLSHKGCPFPTKAGQGRRIIAIPLRKMMIYAERPFRLSACL